MVTRGGERDEITIDLAGGRASIAAAHAGLVREFVSYPRHVFEGQTGQVFGRKEAECLGESPNGRFSFPAKLAFRVGARLKALGHAVRLTGLPRLPQPDAAALAVAPAPLRALFARPHGVAGGRIPANWKWDPWAVIPDLIRLYPTARVVVAVRNRAEVRAWRKHLRNVGVGRPVVDSRGLQRIFFRRPRVLVCTLATLDHCRPQDFDLVLVPDVGPLAGVGPAREVTAAGGWARLTRSHDLLRDAGVPVFGFDPPNRAFSRGEDLRLEAMVGPYLGNGVAWRYPTLRRRAATPAYTSPRRSTRVEAHVGTAADYLARVTADAEVAAGEPGPAQATFLGNLFCRIADDRLLLLATDHVHRHGGSAAGVDGVSPTAMDPAERADLARVLSKAIKSGQYRPGPLKPVEIPKANGGTRTLKLPTVADRVLATAALLAVQPFLDPQFAPTTLGGRPGQSTAKAIALAGRLAKEGDRWHWVAADLRKAFDEVPHDRLAASIRRHLGHTPAAELVVAMATAGGGGVGIPQGSPLSPLLMNLFLHDHLDGPWREANPTAPMLRWVDDVLVVCKDPAEAEQALADLHRLVGDCGMRVKADPAPATADLAAGETVSWLGFELGRTAGEMTAAIGEKGWAGLESALGEIVNDRDEARAIVRGWINAYGPAHAGDAITANIQRIRDVLTSMGTNEVADTDEMTRWAKKAHDHYLDLQRAHDTQSRDNTEPNNTNTTNQEETQTDQPEITPTRGKTTRTTSQNLQTRLNHQGDRLPNRNGVENQDREHQIAERNEERTETKPEQHRPGGNNQQERIPRRQKPKQTRRAGQTPNGTERPNPVNKTDAQHQGGGNNLHDLQHTHRHNGKKTGNNNTNNTDAAPPASNIFREKRAERPAFSPGSSCPHADRRVEYRHRVPARAAGEGLLARPHPAPRPGRGHARRCTRPPIRQGIIRHPGRPRPPPVVRQAGRT